MLLKEWVQGMGVTRNGLKVSVKFSISFHVAQVKISRQCLVDTTFTLCRM